LEIAQAKEFVMDMPGQLRLSLIKLVPTFLAVNVKGSPLPELWL